MFPIRNISPSILLIIAIIALLLLPHWAYSQMGDYNDPCSFDGDRWALEPNPDRQGEYLFTYVNSLSECSHSFDGIGVRAPDGFRVIMYVIIGHNEAENELVYVIPEDPHYMAIPPELDLPDSSEPGTIRIIPGIS